MRSNRATTRGLVAALCAGALSLALVGAAGAAIVTIYTNPFKTNAQYKEIKRSGGGGQCGRGHRKRADMMRITVVGKRLCRFSPPFFGDSAQPDHVITAVGQIVPKKTPKALRKSAYLAVQLRLGRGGYYELQVRPRGKRFKLSRKPSGGGVAARGQSRAIKPLKQLNRIQLEVEGARVKARINGDVVARAVDSAPGALDGRKVAFGLGNRKDSSRAVVGVFKQIRAGVVE